MFHKIKQSPYDDAPTSTRDAIDSPPTCPICGARLMVFVTVLGQLEVWQCRPCGATLLTPARSAAAARSG
jgi:ribosomal protein L37AE/L43A